jgi:hypothetical protein
MLAATLHGSEPKSLLRRIPRDEFLLAEHAEGDGA